MLKKIVFKKDSELYIDISDVVVDTPPVEEPPTKPVPPVEEPPKPPEVLTDELYYEIDAVGLPIFYYNGMPVLTNKMAFWSGPGWAWTEHKITRSTETVIDSDTKQYVWGGKIASLNAEVKGSLLADPNKVTYNMEVILSQAYKDMKGGGFDIIIEQCKFISEAGKTLTYELPNKKQFTIDFNLGENGRLYYEQNNKLRPRFFFVPENNDGIKNTSHSLTITFPPECTRETTADEEYANADYLSWNRGVYKYNSFPIDLSYLNHEVGSKGKVKREGDKLVYGDGTEAKFVIANIAAYSLFSDQLEQEILAKRLAQSGHNCVRIHHHDSDWVTPNVFGPDKTRTKTTELNVEAMDRLCLFLKILRKNKIYFMLDLHVQRLLDTGDNVIDTYAEVKSSTQGIKAVNYVDKNGVAQLMKNFNEQYLTYYNKFNGCMMKDDPGLIAVMITNENDITSHFGTLIQNPAWPKIKGMFDAETLKYSEKTGLPVSSIKNIQNLGNGKYLANELEANFFIDMINHLKGLGVTAPIICSSIWGDNKVHSIPSLTVGDIIDGHYYFGEGTLTNNPLYSGNMGAWAAFNQVEGYPTFITELNWVRSQKPSIDRCVGPLYMTGLACLQEWSGYSVYCYSQVPLPNNASPKPGLWDTMLDSALISTIAMGALVYRLGYVSKAKSSFVLNLTDKEISTSNLYGDNCLTTRTLADKSKIKLRMQASPYFSWLKATTSNATVINSPHVSALYDETNTVSDTGEIMRNWKEKIHYICAPKFQAMQGILKNDTKMGLITVVKNAHPVLSLSMASMDNAELIQSDKILFNAVGRCWKENQNQDIFTEPINAHITLKLKQGLSFYRLGPGGALAEKLDVSYDYNNAAYHFYLKGYPNTMYMIKKD